MNDDARIDSMESDLRAALALAGRPGAPGEPLASMVSRVRVLVGEYESAKRKIARAFSLQEAAAPSLVAVNVVDRMALLEESRRVRLLDMTRARCASSPLTSGGEASSNRDDRIAELTEERDALKMNAIEQSEVYAQTVQDLALALGVELSPCSSGCPGHLPAEGVAKLKRKARMRAVANESLVNAFVQAADARAMAPLLGAIVNPAEKESEGSVPQLVKDAAAVLNRKAGNGRYRFAVAFDLWDGAS